MIKVNITKMYHLADVFKVAAEVERVTVEYLAATVRGFVAKHADAVMVLDYL